MAEKGSSEKGAMAAAAATTAAPPRHKPEGGLAAVAKTLKESKGAYHNKSGSDGAEQPGKGSATQDDESSPNSVSSGVPLGLRNLLDARAVESRPAPGHHGVPLSIRLDDLAPPPAQLFGYQLGNDSDGAEDDSDLGGGAGAMAAHALSPPMSPVDVVINASKRKRQQLQQEQQQAALRHKSLHPGPAAAATTRAPVQLLDVSFMRSDAMALSSPPPHPPMSFATSVAISHGLASGQMKMDPRTNNYVPNDIFVQVSSS